MSHKYVSKPRSGRSDLPRYLFLLGGLTSIRHRLGITYIYVSIYDTVLLPVYLYMSHTLYLYFISQQTENVFIIFIHTSKYFLLLPLRGEEITDIENKSTFQELTRDLQRLTMYIDLDMDRSSVKKKKKIKNFTNKKKKTHVILCIRYISYVL
jgi:hypothetical protein